NDLSFSNLSRLFRDRAHDLLVATEARPEPLSDFRQLCLLRLGASVVSPPPVGVDPGRLWLRAGDGVFSEAATYFSYRQYARTHRFPRDIQVLRIRSRESQRRPASFRGRANSKPLSISPTCWPFLLYLPIDRLRR